MESARRIRNANKLLLHVIEHDPMVAFPVNYCWKRHLREMAVRNFQWARRQPKFGRRARNRFQARTIGRGVTELSNPCQAYLSTKVSADHSEAGGTAIHLVDLHDVIDLSEAFAMFTEQTSLVSERLFLTIRLFAGLLAIELHFVVHLCFSGEQFGREIERNTRLCFCLIPS